MIYLIMKATSQLQVKRAGGDIKEKKITFPLIYSLNQVSPIQGFRDQKDY